MTLRFRGIVRSLVRRRGSYSRSEQQETRAALGESESPCDISAGRRNVRPPALSVLLRLTATMVFVVFFLEDKPCCSSYGLNLPFVTTSFSLTGLPTHCEQAIHFSFRGCHGCNRTSQRNLIVLCALMGSCSAALHHILGHCNMFGSLSIMQNSTKGKPQNTLWWRSTLILQIIIVWLYMPIW